MLLKTRMSHTLCKDEPERDKWMLLYLRCASSYLASFHLEKQGESGPLCGTGTRGWKTGFQAFSSKLPSQFVLLCKDMSVANRRKERRTENGFGKALHFALALCGVVQNADWRV